MNIRSALANDAACVAEVYLASRKVLVSFAQLAHADSDVRQWIREVLIPAGGVSVGLVDDRIVGMMAITTDEEGYGWIDHLYLDPAFVGQGLGSQLLRHGLDHLPRPVRLYSFAENVNACRFYERYGFRPIEYGDGSDNEEGCPDILYELAM